MSIGSTQHYSWKLGTKTMHGVYGYDSSNGDATATNWDPFASHELTVVLHCTTDPTKASIYEAHRSILG